MPIHFDVAAHAFNLGFGIVCLLVMLKYYRDLTGGVRKTVACLCAFVTCSCLISISYIGYGYPGIAFWVFHAGAMFFFGLAFGFFADTLWIVALYSLRMASPEMFQYSSSNNRPNRPLHLRFVPDWLQLKDVSMTGIRIMFMISSIVIMFVFVFVLIFIISLGSPSDSTFDPVRFNDAIMYACTALSTQNVFFFPSFTIMALFLLQTLAESIEHHQQTQAKSALDLGAQTTLAKLIAVRDRIALFSFLAVVVLAPVEFLLFVVLYPIMRIFRLPGMYLVSFFTFIVLNVSLSIILFAVKGRVTKVVAPAIAEVETAMSLHQSLRRERKGPNRGSTVHSSKDEGVFHSNNGENDRANASRIVDMPIAAYQE